MNFNNCGLILRCEWVSGCYINWMEFKLMGKVNGYLVINLNGLKNGIYLINRYNG